MRVLSVLVALASFTTSQARAQDPTVVDSRHYRVVFENDQVRVLRITYGPHERSVMHDHPAGVVVFLTDQRGKFTLPAGQTVEIAGRAGEAIWTEAGAHLPENLGNEPFELILVEIKTPPARAR